MQVKLCILMTQSDPHIMCSVFTHVCRKVSVAQNIYIVLKLSTRLNRLYATDWFCILKGYTCADAGAAAEAARPSGPA